VLEQEARVREIEAPPLVGAEREVGGVARAELDERALPRLGGERARALELLGAPLHGDDALARRVRDQPGELPEPAPDFERALAATRGEGSLGAAVQERVEIGEAALLLGMRAVHVARGGGHGRETVPEARWGLTWPASPR